ncbi:MAG: amidohydrolase [Bacteroidetes bacterium]|nr:amidohydrolase [Bacteroidota bacterium]
MHDLTLTMVQAELAWEDAEANLLHFERMLEKLNDPTDLIILPEMFNTGFTMDPAGNGEAMNGRSMNWMAETALKKGCHICGSLIIHEKGNYYNRLIWMHPDGSFTYYDKKHLFRMGEEHQYYSAGSKKMIAELKGWKVLPLVCYDLRFPVWSKNEFKGGQYAYELLIYIANWPSVRSTAWKSLLSGRAIENMAFVAGVNRIGQDGRGFEYSGESMVAGPEGEITSSIPAGIESIKTVTLKASGLMFIRNKLGIGKDWDGFRLE